MSKMYYAEMPDAAHDIHDLKVALLGQGFHFYTDAGVFSKKRWIMVVRSCSML